MADSTRDDSDPDDPLGSAIQEPRKSSGKESGAQGEQRRKREREQSDARQRERVGTPDLLAKLHERVGPAPLNAVANVAWLSNLLTGTAEIVIVDPVMGVEDKIKALISITKAVGDVKDTAALAERIRALEEGRSAGVKDKPDGLDKLPARRPSPTA